MATITVSNPEGVHAPASAYSHAALIEGTGKRLIISGQVGVAADGTVSTDPEGQIDQVFANLLTVLKAHGMTQKNVAKITVFLTDRMVIGPWRRKRDAWFEGHAAAATLILVAGLADPRFVVEVEAEAYA
ncbi:RidA family protein [Roseomonas sp. OT10]|uniref:RidA family protein n=1 Tax=Roseomonas cutis TaxID=2897332 RepID=UPI001E2C2DA3|nr:RidA family protein [Roseomonas sp. OT10]UFN47003.1 RidA family protein [Roseomonas sp. OT10]